MLFVGVFDVDFDLVPRVVEQTAHVPQRVDAIWLRIAITVGRAHCNFDLHSLSGASNEQSSIKIP